MTVFSHPTFRGLFSAVCDAPGNMSPQLILRDWLIGAGAPDAVADEAVLCRPMTWWDIWSFGSGIGSGIGIGIGIGSGRGSGSGIGSGSGREPYQVKPMRIGQAYLIHCGDWHTFVGRVVSQVGPATYEMELVSKVSETNNGDCWDQLAAGDERLRQACTYKHYKTKAVIPLAIAAFEWSGKLPQEM